MRTQDGRKWLKEQPSEKPKCDGKDTDKKLKNDNEFCSWILAIIMKLFLLLPKLHIYRKSYKYFLYVIIELV